MTEEQINKAIARVILSTKRKSRQYSLYDIAVDIAALKKAKGSMNEVAKDIGITSGMLSRFLSVFKLPPPIQNLVKERKIDSIAMAMDLTKLGAEDALKLTELISTNKLSTQDIRTLIAYRKQYKNESLVKLVEKIHSSKNIKASVIRINKEDTTKSIKELNFFFINHVGRENLITIEPNKEFIDIKLSKNGEKILRQIAKTNKTTLQGLIVTLIN